MSTCFCEGFKKINVITSLLLGLALGVHAGDGDLLFWNFKDMPYVKAQVETSSAFPEYSLVLNKDSVYPSSVDLDRPVKDTFSINLVLKVDQFISTNTESENKWGFINLCLLMSQQGQKNIIFRINPKHQFELAVFSGGKYHLFASNYVVPLKQWTQVAITFDRGNCTLWVNGAVDRTGSLNRCSRSSSRLIIAADDNGQRRLSGGLAVVDITDVLVEKSALKKYGAALESQFKDWKPQALEMDYRPLRVENDVIHPICGGIDIHAELVPWSGNDRMDLLVDGPTKYRGRVSVYQQDESVGNRAAPVYDSGKPVALAGESFCRIDRQDGLFDLICWGNGTPYGEKELVYYQNVGRFGNPEFILGGKVLFNGKSIYGYLPRKSRPYIFFKDMDKDGVADILLTASTRGGGWPNGAQIWSYMPEETALGAYQPYDIAGNWLAEESEFRLYWAKGKRNPEGRLDFGELKKIAYQTPLHQVVWYCHSTVSPGYIEVNGKPYIVLFGNMYDMLAMPVELTNGELLCQKAVPLLADSKRIERTYVKNSISVGDMDNDGVDEILLAGNPGQVVVFKGNRIGEFTEHLLNIKGGYVSVETLAVPCRVDWDRDGYQDIVCGDSSGFLTFWPGTGDPLVYGEPVYLKSDGKTIHVRAGRNGSLQGPAEDGWGYLQPTTGSWGGRLGVIINDTRGDLYFYPKGNDKHNLLKPERLTLNGTAMQAAWRTRPSILDSKYGYAGDSSCLVYLDYQGDLAVAVSQAAGGTDFKESIKLRYSNGKNIRLCGSRGLWGRVKITVADWDGDGKWDVLVGSHRSLIPIFYSKSKPERASVFLFKNMGTSSEPVFDEPRLMRKSDGSPVNLGWHIMAVWPTDMNNDGTQDLIVGSEDGKIYVFYRDEVSFD